MSTVIPPGPTFQALVQTFFTSYLIDQRAVSPRTVTTYRDAFTLLLEHAERTLGKAPASLALADIDETLILSFLDDLETRRGNAVRTRNARLAAIRSFLQFATHRDVANLATMTAALSVPMKRFERPIVGFLSREQMFAVLDLPGKDWLATRDRLLLHLLYNSGARVSELVSIRVDDIVTDDGACVRLLGKGRKRRTVPLWKNTAKRVRAWLALEGAPTGEGPLLPTRQGAFMTRANAAQRLAIAVKHATERRPELAMLTISPHTIRHTTAMHLLQSGVDISVIALWLGHESPATTHHYVEADLAMKERALARLEAPEHPSYRYRPPDSLIGFLRAL
ncbi:tyrosine-type recombinase/integrase [Wenzhouxiangella limi]|uniref:Tyrosine-type recombinase/integrase n=1 Tax=Wenzhouxiangella limi TaxID=2707351 RepID=A0A845V126_9GAMM|nr:tyrosine-type recombinase/integrase [Wenzhouxiangella limi]NDY94372.1 tyrosine-type recombinase/integrase [Wenzhouxiangella limi]NDY94393.1 tyrosine-type recombinase/integrase [Wenzhouxiangella limi]NDY95056.1 tyrosine-type recombinase/integrase [Wenzhouxiangella limi]NDY96434.1 tyrosine-type recombinase/integrase [Wenzhouxiangella limi]